MTLLLCSLCNSEEIVGLASCRRARGDLLREGSGGVVVEQDDFADIAEYGRKYCRLILVAVILLASTPQPARCLPTSDRAMLANSLYARCRVTSDTGTWVDLFEFDCLLVPADILSPGDMPPTLACGACGKVYVSPRFLSDHERRGCRPSKRALSEMLEVSKTLWLARKKRRIQDSLEGPGSKVASSDSGDNLSHCHAKSSTPSPNLSQRQDEHNAPGKVSSPHHQALSEQEDRRTRRTIRMPVRFLDAAPAPYAPLSDSGGNSELHPTIGNHARHLLGTPPEKDRSVQLASTSS
ncbi:hypothetical protein BKA70DRAFT_1237208 [Coprinopsis sp. MPI-PUGE-AT-0042]|nr:hypothetical protein BKA70DRAFT_1237208 [Coprinopsis sp. MPI-PUGE-AT-0042]